MCEANQIVVPSAEDVVEKNWKGAEKFEKYLADGMSKEEAGKRVREENVNKRSQERDDKESKKSKKDEKKKDEKKSKDHKEKESRKDSQESKSKEHKSDHKSEHKGEHKSSQSQRDLDIEPAEVPAKPRTLGASRKR
jgi:Mg-chelatase subunit ChlI